MRRTEATNQNVTQKEGGSNMRIERKEAEQLVTKRFNTSSVRLVGKLVAQAIAKAQMRTARKFYGKEYETLALNIIDEVLEQVSEAVFTELGKVSRHYDNVIKSFLIEKYLEEGNPSKYMVEMVQIDFAIIMAMTDAYTKAEKEFWTAYHFNRWLDIHSKNIEEERKLEAMALAVFDTLHNEIAKAIGELEVALSEAQRDVGYFVKEEGR